MSAIKCISGIVTRIIIFALHNGILYLYQLTDLQYLLFKKCLVVYSIEAVTHFILEFKQKSHNKHNTMNSKHLRA